MPPLFIDKISGRIGPGVDAVLGQVTALTGPNGSGKSAIVKALVAAVSEGAPGVLGRDYVKKAGFLNKIVTGRTGGPQIMASFSTGGTISRTGWGAKEHSRPAFLLAGADIIPVRTIREAAVGESGKLRELCLRAACRDVTEQDVLTKVPEGLQALYATVRGAGLPPVEGLIAALEVARSMGAASAADAETQKAAAEARGAALPPEPDDAMIDAARARVASLAGWRILPTINQYRAIVTQYAIIDAQLRALPADPEAPPGETHRALIAAITHVLDYNVTQAPHECIVCGTGMAPTVLTSRRDAVAVLNAQYNERVATYAALIASVGGQRVMFTTQLTALKTQGQMLYKMLVDAGIADPDGLPPTITDADLRAAEGELSRLLADRASWVAMTEAKARAVALTTRAQQYTQLAEVCADAQARLLTAGVTAFEKRISTIIGADLVTGKTANFRLILTEKNKDGEVKNTCLIGWERDGVLHEDLSHAEFERTYIALAIDSINPAIPYALVYDDHGDYDPDTFRVILQSTVAALATRPNIQAVFANPTPFSKRTPKGVTHIECTLQAGTPPAVNDDVEGTPPALGATVGEA